MCAIIIAPLKTGRKILMIFKKNSTSRLRKAILGCLFGIMALFGTSLLFTNNVEATSQKESFLTVGLANPVTTIATAANNQQNTQNNQNNQKLNRICQITVSSLNKYENHNNMNLNDNRYANNTISSCRHSNTNGNIYYIKSATKNTKIYTNFNSKIIKNLKLKKNSSSLRTLDVDKNKIKY